MIILLVLKGGCGICVFGICVFVYLWRVNTESFGTAWVLSPPRPTNTQLIRLCSKFAPLNCPCPPFPPTSQQLLVSPLPPRFEDWGDFFPVSGIGGQSL